MNKQTGLTAEPIALQMRRFARQFFRARIAKDNAGQYQMQVRPNSATLNIRNHHEVLAALFAECGAAVMSTASVMVFDFHGCGKVSLATGDEDTGSLTFMNKVSAPPKAWTHK